MLDLLKNIDNKLLAAFWAVSLFFIVVSVILCLILSLRRILRNHNKNKRLKEQYKFEIVLNKALTSQSNEFYAMSIQHKDSSLFNEVLLRYFRMLNGKRAETLRTICEHLDIEPQLRESTKVGTIGRRMEAMQVLSFLSTQGSLLSIHEGLSSSKKYIRLTSARCLTRRKADIFIDDIIFSINAAFPDDPQLLADILFRFGYKVTPTIESYIQSDSNDCIKAACLEALVLAMPAEVSLDLDMLLESSDEGVRAAAISLSAITSHNSQEDLLTKALSDPSTKVKIRAAKIAHTTRRKDTISPLFKLTKDPLLWVRYWSTKAIWNTGRQGRKLVETIARGDDTASQMAREISLECSTQDFGAAL